MANKIPLAYADIELQLSTAISTGDTTFSVSSANDDDGNALPAGLYCFTVNNGASNKQYLIGQLNGTDITNVKTVSRQGVESTGAQYSARIGDTAIVTNFATLQRVADILRGVETADGSNPLNYDAEPALTNRKEIATVGYVLDNITGGSVSFDNQTITGVNAGESVASGDLLYLKTSDQEWYKTDATTVTTVNDVALAFAKGSGSDGVAITDGVQISGVVTLSGLTAGATYYASDTAGGISTTAGTTKRVIGVALSTTRLFMVPVNEQTPTSDEKDALVGTSETPSATNRFVTSDDVSATNTGDKILRLTKGTGINKKITTSATTTEIANDTTTETNIFQVSIPANLLGTTNAIRVKLYISDFTVASGECTIRLKYGATTIATISSSNPGSSHGPLKGVIEANVIASTATAQIGNIILGLVENKTDPSLVYGSDTATSFLNLFGSGSATEDSTTALNLTMTVQWGAANASSNFVPTGYTIELIS